MSAASSGYNISFKSQFSESCNIKKAQLINDFFSKTSGTAAFISFLDSFFILSFEDSIEKEKLLSTKRY